MSLSSLLSAHAGTPFKLFNTQGAQCNKNYIKSGQHIAKVSIPLFYSHTKHNTKPSILVLAQIFAWQVKLNQSSHLAEINKSVVQGLFWDNLDKICMNDADEN